MITTFHARAGNGEAGIEHGQFGAGWPHIFAKLSEWRRRECPRADPAPDLASHRAKGFSRHSPDGPLGC
jgi:hypothetical protein